MEKSPFTRAYDVLKAKLVQMRKAAGLSQRKLARRLRREHSFVARIELGERRLDVVEFYRVCKACGADPAATARAVYAAISILDAERSR